MKTVLEYNKIEEDIRDILCPYDIKNRGKYYWENAKEIRQYLEQTKYLEENFLE